MSRRVEIVTIRWQRLLSLEHSISRKQLCPRYEFALEIHNKNKA